MPSKRHMPLATRGSGPGNPVVVHARGLEAVERLAGSGWGPAAIAAHLGISKTAFQAVRKRQPEVDEAMARGHAAVETELVEGLLAKARDGNIAAAFFLLKTRHGYREVGPTDNAPTVAVQIVLPAALSREEYAKAIDAEFLPAPKEATHG